MKRQNAMPPRPGAKPYDRALFYHGHCGHMRGIRQAQALKAWRDAIYRRISRLPDAFMFYAQRCLEDMEVLPANLGRYLLHELWPDYLGENPQLKRQPARSWGCSECEGYPGTIYAWQKKGKVYYEFSLACVCKAGFDTGWTRARALEHGFLLRDPYLPIETPEIRRQ